jgi:hypothetical protein
LIRIPSKVLNFLAINWWRQYFDEKRLCPTKNLVRTFGVAVFGYHQHKIAATSPLHMKRIITALQKGLVLLRQRGNQPSPKHLSFLQDLTARAKCNIEDTGVRAVLQDLINDGIGAKSCKQMLKQAGDWKVLHRQVYLCILQKRIQRAQRWQQWHQLNLESAELTTP